MQSEQNVITTHCELLTPNESNTPTKKKMMHQHLHNKSSNQLTRIAITHPDVISVDSNGFFCYCQHQACFLLQLNQLIATTYIFLNQNADLMDQTVTLSQTERDFVWAMFHFWVLFRNLSSQSPHSYVESQNYNYDLGH